MASSERTPIIISEEARKRVELSKNLLDYGYVAISTGRDGLKGLRRKYKDIVKGLDYKQIWGEEGGKTAECKFVFYSKKQFEVREIDIASEDDTGVQCGPGIVFYGGMVTTDNNGKKRRLIQAVMLVPKVNNNALDNGKAAC